MKGKRRKKEEGGIPSREAQCTPYAAGQGKSRQREQEERNQKKESDITAPKHFDNYKLICDFPSVFKLTPRQRRSLVRLRVEKGKQGENHLPTDAQSKSGRCD